MKWFLAVPRSEVDRILTSFLRVGQELGGYDRERSRLACLSR
jgi:hypothetical protein